VAPIKTLARDGRLEPISSFNLNGGADAPPVACQHYFERGV